MWNAHSSVVALVGVFLMSTASGHVRAVNASKELAQMYRQDQSDRRNLEKSGNGGWSEVTQHDKEHQQRVVELLKAGKLKSAKDFFHAAMIMQHGNEPQQLVLAHVLSEASAQRGYKPAVWLTAASFDRLMQKVGQPQVFGTQYSKDANGPWTMDPFSEELLPDSLRKAFNAPELAACKERLNSIAAQQKSP